jgi:hypothetical protein
VTETGESVISDDIVLRHVNSELLEEERRHLMRSASDGRILNAAVRQREMLKAVDRQPNPWTEEGDDNDDEGDGSNAAPDFHSVKTYWKEASKRNTPPRK